MDLLHQDSGMYQIYNEYLQTVQRYAIDSKIKALSIRYYRINMTRTNTDEELSMMMTKKYGSTYDIYDLTPVLEMSPLMYTSDNDDTNQGVIRRTNGTLTILGIAEPLPGDLFHFYDANGNDEKDNIEYFTVDNVNYNKDAASININQVEFSTANITKRSVEQLTILNQFYYIKEFKKFFSSDLYQNYSQLLEHRNDYVDLINTYYNPLKCWFSIKETGHSKKEYLNDLINNVIYYLNDKYALSFNPVLMEPSRNVLVIRRLIENGTITLDEIGLNNPEFITNVDDINLIRKVSELQFLYNSFENYELPDNNKIGTDIEKTNSVVRDLDGNVI